MSDAREKGARVEVGGERNESLGPLFYQPTVLTHTSSEMRITQEEIFGPLAPVMK